MSKQPQVPKHLSAESKRWYATITGDYALESHHLRLLQAACESWDRCQQARQQLADEGCTFTDRHGAIRPHPSINIERDSRIAFVRIIRELGLDIESPAEVKPPTIQANRRA
jgi:P27 family predicted phage terminase small subunit